jgi:hypothetical protein
MFTISGVDKVVGRSANKGSRDRNMPHSRRAWEMTGGNHEKAAKQTKRKASSKRGAVKSTKSGRSTTSSKSESASSSPRSKIKRVASKAAAAAVVAGGMAAIGTVLSELRPTTKKPEGAASDEKSGSDEGKSTR